MTPSNVSLGRWGRARESETGLSRRRLARRLSRENPDHVQRLIHAGCHAFQGYHYSEPIEARAISDLMAGRTKLAA